MRALPLLRRDVPDGRGELRISRGIHRPVPDPGARRVLAEEVVPLPVRRRPDRPRNEPPAGVRADVAQAALDAARAQRRYPTAHACTQPPPSQFPVAAFAGSAALQHRQPAPMLTLAV